MTTKDGLSFEVTQVPSNNNNYTAIVQATQNIHGTTITDFAIADSTDTGNQVPKIILEHARTKAKNRIENLNSDAASNPQQQMPYPTHSPAEGTQSHAQNQSSQNTTPQNASDRNYKHSHNKPASNKQLEALEDIAARRGTTLSTAAETIVNKPSQDLSSYDADLLFKHFKANS